MHHYVAADLGLKGNRGGADRFAQPELCAQFYTAANRGWRRERRATRRGAVRLWVLAVLLRLGNRYGAALALWHLKGPLICCTWDASKTRSNGGRPHSGTPWASSSFKRSMTDPHPCYPTRPDRIIGAPSWCSLHLSGWSDRDSSSAEKQQWMCSESMWESGICMRP
jgi:hypothetical protein